MVAAIILAVNFKKPMGFFRESNAALVCINTNIWLQNDHMRNSHIPATTYSFSNKALQSTPLYGICATFGYAWFSVPYYFFSITHLPVNEIGLRLFALCWFAFTVFTIYLLARSLTSYYGFNKQATRLTICLYILSPAILWYQVQGYVHEIAVLPFYYLAWLSFLHYLHNGNRLKALLFTAACIFIGVQFDWLPCMQAMVMGCYLLVQRKQVKHPWAFLLPAAAIITGVFYIFYTYSSWAGTNNYIQHLQDKFLNRTMGGGDFHLIPFLNHNFNILVFYALSYGLLPLLFIAGLIKLKIKNPVLWMLMVTAALHHLVFWGFSTEHDHAVVKMAFPLLFITALYIGSLRPYKQYMVTAMAITINIVLYFLLHNYNYRKGMYTDPNFCYTIGNGIKQLSTDPAEYVFVDTENRYYPQIEFYANKTYIMANSVEAAQQFMQKRNIHAKGCFIQLKDNKIVGSIRFNNMQQQ